MHLEELHEFPHIRDLVKAGMDKSPYLQKRIPAEQPGDPEAELGELLQLQTDLSSYDMSVGQFYFSLGAETQQLQVEVETRDRVHQLNLSNMVNVTAARGRSAVLSGGAGVGASGGRSVGASGGLRSNM